MIKKKFYSLRILFFLNSQNFIIPLPSIRHAQEGGGTIQPGQAKDQSNSPQPAKTKPKNKQQKEKRQQAPKKKH
jgi:hypothetical protein